MPQSISDMLRKEIRKELDQGADYSTTAKRNEFHEKFLKRHPDITCDRTLISRRFKEAYEERGVDLYSVGLSRKKKYNEKLAAEINEKAKISKQEAEPEMHKEQLQESVIPELKYDYLTVQSVSAVFRGMLSPLRAINPELELSQEEADCLAQIWIPGIKKLGSEKFQYLVLPTIGACGMIGTHVYEGYRLHKEQQN
ncbi:hypothetical protein [Nitrosopumilus sp.]|uniref:hypothetical protein n=1 Tax=Nitrosopumilus sp. TaxID=2024843 RepID=UPI00349FF590